jgi:hypothetical protein
MCCAFTNNTSNCSARMFHTGFQESVDVPANIRDELVANVLGFRGVAPDHLKVCNFDAARREFLTE